MAVGDARLAVAGRLLPRGRTFCDLPQGAAFWYENSNGLAEMRTSRTTAPRQHCPIVFDGQSRHCVADIAIRPMVRNRARTPRIPPSASHWQAHVAKADIKATLLMGVSLCDCHS
jgi:hypothetical protein